MTGFSFPFRGDDDEDEDELIESYKLWSDDPEHFLTGQVLVAMPQMGDPRFEHSVIYVCAHNASGAMGLILNKEHDSVTLIDMFEQLDIQPNTNLLPSNQRNAVMTGGPVETSRGFVLHSLDYSHESTVQITNDIGLTASIDIVTAISDGTGPKNYVIALGCSAWGAGQLEDEFNENSWLNVSADDHLLFDIDRRTLWKTAIAKLGVDPGLLHATVGNA